MKSWSVKVPKEEGESTRKKLSERQLLDPRLEIEGEGDFLYLPVKSIQGLEGYELHERDFDTREMPQSDYRENVDLPPTLMELLPSSYDVIGDLALIKLPDALVPHADEVGEALLETFPRLRAVFLDRGVEGEFRVRELTRVAGTGTPETTHKEYGIHLRVDPTVVYFNPRLAGERHRVASQVEGGETVIDMFAGVGPFSIMAARHSAPAEVYSIDINPHAIRYLKENIRINKTPVVTPVEGDAREEIRHLPMADRIIMNLPHSATDFLESAVSKLREGGIIHFYLVEEREDVESSIDLLHERIEATDTSLEVVRKDELKTYSPTMSVYSLDLQLS